MIGEGAEAIGIINGGGISGECCALGGGACDGESARWAVVDVGDCRSGRRRQRFCGATAIGVGSDNGDGFADLLLGEGEGIGGCTIDRGAIGLPLIGEGADAIEIGDGGWISGESFALGRCACDDESARWAVVGIGDDCCRCRGE